jgi:hypothetical protein
MLIFLKKFAFVRKREGAHTVFTRTCMGPCVFRCVTVASEVREQERFKTCPSKILCPAVRSGDYVVVELWFCEFTPWRPAYAALKLSNSPGTSEFWVPE